MWKCPVCGREFAKDHQSHFCSSKPKTIDEYISQQSEEHRADLILLRATLARALPEAEERISWSMPTYWKGSNILHFSAFKNHIGFYPGAEAIEHFAEELRIYKTEKGTVRIPYGKIDTELIHRIARWCLETLDS